MARDNAANLLRLYTLLLSPLLTDIKLSGLYRERPLLVIGVTGTMEVDMLAFCSVMLS